jgi:hypothetical protein
LISPPNTSGATDPNAAFLSADMAKMQVSGMD